MTSMKKKVALVALALGSLALAACGGSGGSASNSASGSGKKHVFSLITHGAASDQFWQVVKGGADQAGKDFGVTVNYQSDPDPVRQSTLIDNAVAQKVSGIIVSMANPQGLKDSIEKAIKAGIPVIGINGGIDEWKQYGEISWVGQDELVAGQALGEYLKGRGHKAVCVLSDEGNIGQEKRCKGFKEKFGGQVENFYTSINDPAQAKNVILAKLKTDPNIDTVITLNSSVGVQASEAVHELGRDGKVVQATFGIDSNTIKLLEDGRMDVAVDVQPYLQGYLPVELMQLYLNNGNVVGGGQAVLTGPNFITKENAASAAKFAARGTR